MPHRRAAILSIGDELTLGQTLDTNSRYLSQQLVDRGIIPACHLTIPDDRAAIVRALRDLAQSADLILITGGLGPTADDLTRHALADALGEPLVEDAESLDAIVRRYRAAGRDMPPINRVQALRPSSAQAIPNPHGTAPGLRAQLPAHEPALCASHAHEPRRVDVFCLPGPPHEMKPMFESAVVPRLVPVTIVRTRAVHTFGIGESDLAARLGDLMARDRHPTVGTTASRGVVSCRIRAERAACTESACESELDREIEATAERVRALASPYVFGEGEETLPGAVVGLLRARGERLAVAESCTGGLLGEMLTRVPGSSAAFVGGWITYSNERKSADLGVPTGVLERVGAVSREVAEAMAAGARARAGVEHALAITGIAGPEGGSADKPVGTVWIARACEMEVETRRFVFTGMPREVVRELSAMSALGMLRLALVGARGVMLMRER
ncbi:MAG: CinA family nicotinamide mononucleotide deamidase-related protein [Phycisphaerales bacterium]